MGVRIINSSYRNPFSNASESTTGFPNWLIGNVADWITARFTVEVGVDFKASIQNQLQFDYDEKTIRLSNGKKWGDYGFDIGNSVTIKINGYVKNDINSPTWTPNNSSSSITIINIIGSVLYYSGGNDLSSMNEEIIPYERSAKKITSLLMYCNINFEGIRLRYSLIPNSDIQSNSLLSLIDGTETELFAYGIQNSQYQYINLTSIGMQSGMAIDNAKIKLNQGYDLINGNRVRINPSRGNIILDHGISELVLTPNLYSNYLQKPINQSIKKEEDLTVDYCIIQNYSGNEDIVIENISRFIIEDKGSDVPKNLSLVYRVISDDNKVLRKQIIKSIPINRESLSEIVFDNEDHISLKKGENLHIGYDLSTSNDTSLYPTNLGYNVSGGLSYSAINITPGGYKKRYDIVLNYMITPFWDQISDIEQRRIPSFLENSESLTDNKNFKFYPVWNNPNTQVENDMTETQRLGNTGWFNENYNGLPNNFNVKSVSYFNSNGVRIEALDYVNQTNVEVVVSGIRNLDNLNSVISYGFAWIPIDEDDYKNKTTPFHKNARINSPLNSVFNLGSVQPSIRNGFSPDGNSRIDSKNISVLRIGSDVLIKFTLIPTVQFSEFIQNRNKDYMIWVSVEDSIPVTNMSDRVTLLADSREMIHNIVTDGELDGVNIGFLEHPYYDDSDMVDLYDGFIVDDLVCSVDFGIPTGSQFIGMRYGFEAEKDNIIVNLESNSLSFSDFPIVNGATEIEYTSNRGFLLEDFGYRNKVSVSRNHDYDTNNKRMYKAYFGNKIRYEDWIEKSGVSSVFFNSDLLNNGFNNNWFDYQDSGGTIYFFIIFEYIENNIIYRKKNRSKIKIRNYNSNNIIEKRFVFYDNESNRDITIGFDNNLNAITGPIMNDRLTRVDVLFKSLIPDVFLDKNNMYATATIELKDGAGYMQNRMISTIYPVDSENPLKPLENNEIMEIDQISNNEIKISFIIDPNLIPNGSKYMITARIGCYNTNTERDRIYDPENYEYRYE